MRPLATLAAAFALAPAAAAQTSPAPAGSATATVAAPTLGGGQVVGNSPTFGKPGAPVAPAVGNGLGQTGAIQNPTLNMPGMSIDPANVVGPLPEGFVPGAPKSEWRLFLEKYGEKFGLIDPPKPAPQWTPGLARRNRERAAERAQMWRRD